MISETVTEAKSMYLSIRLRDTDHRLIHSSDGGGEKEGVGNIRQISVSTER